MAKVKVCPICGNEFTGRGKYCSDECRKEQDRLRRTPRTIKVCPICGTEFKGTSKDKYCSHECAKLSNLRKTKSNWFDRNSTSIDTARSIQEVNPNAQLGTDANGNLIYLYGSNECASDIRSVESKWAKYTKMEEDIKSSNHH